MAEKRRRASRIRLQPDPGGSPSLVLGGWWAGPFTYLWIGLGDRCLGTISGARLRRFAERVLREIPPPGNRRA